MTTDDILRAAIECQLITTGNRDSFYAAALVRFANLVRTESLDLPAGEPVAWMHPDGRIWTFGRGFDKATFTIPLYTAPQPRREVELTGEEIDEVWNSLIATPDFSRVKIARAIIEAYKAKQGETK